MIEIPQKTFGLQHVFVKGITTFAETFISYPYQKVVKASLQIVFNSFQTDDSVKSHQLGA